MAGANTNDLEGHSPTASLSKSYLSYRFALVDRISTDMRARAVPLR